MNKNVNEITLYKNLKKRLREDELFNRFEMEPVEESKELALIEEENGTIIEIDVSYEIEGEQVYFDEVENMTYMDNKENNDVYLEDDSLKRTIKENNILKEEIENLKREVRTLREKNLRLENILTKEQKIIFKEDDIEYINKSNKLTNAEKLLLEKRDELSRRSNIRKRSWLKQMLG